MKYFLSCVGLFLCILISALAGFSCTPLVEQGGFADAKATVSSVVNTTEEQSTEEDDNSTNTDDSTNPGTSDPTGPEDVEPVPEEGDSPITSGL